MAKTSLNKTDGLVLISSCMVGLKTRYDGGSKNIDRLFKLVKEGKAVFACPEQLGGLPTPRAAAEIEYGKTAKDVLAGNGRVLTKLGDDVTKQFVSGAEKVLALCKELGIKKVILKEKSPSCGGKFNYDGTFSKTLIEGRGITAELLIQNGIEVFSEDSKV